MRIDAPDQSRVVWRKSSYSQPTQSDCVEVAQARGALAVRDSKDPNGPVLLIRRTGWSGLLYRVKQGALDL